MDSPLAAADGAASDPDSLTSLYTDAVRRYEAIEASTKAGCDPDYQAEVEGALHAMHKVAMMVRQLALFSDNETIDDATTEDLKYLLVEYYIGKLSLKVVPSAASAAAATAGAGADTSPAQVAAAAGSAMVAVGPEIRVAQLRRAEVSLNAFEERCVMLAVPRADGGDGDASAARSAGEAKRARKLARYRQAQSLKARIAELRALESMMHERREQPDEELVRERVLKAVQLALNDSEDERASLKQELEMLSMMAKMAGAGVGAGGRGGQGGNGAADPRTRPTEARDARQAAPLEVTRIEKDALGKVQIKRQQLADGVFQPFWRQPTKTLAELAEEELADAMRRQEAEKEAAKNRPARRIAQLEEEGLEDEADLVDAATQRDREWDDWKDDNPKGIGNKANKRI